MGTDLPRELAGARDDVADGVADGVTDDVATAAALGAIAYVVSMLAHEALGHGLACLATGGRVTAVWALDLRCDLGPLTTSSADLRIRVGAAAGPLVPVLLGALLLASLRAWLRARVARPQTRRADAGVVVPLLAWLGAAFLLLPNIGYFCLAAGRTGDWAIALDGLPAGRYWRPVVAAGGAALYWFTARALFRLLGRLTTSTPEGGWRRGRDLARYAYAVAAVLAFGAGARQAGAASAVGLSGLRGVVASLAGSSGLLWGARALQRSTAYQQAGALPPLPRRAALIALGVGAGLAFVFVLGPGVQLR